MQIFTANCAFSAAIGLGTALMNFTGTAWTLVGRLANRVQLAKFARRDRWLVVLFHHITDGSKWRSDDPLIQGLNVNIDVKAFKDRVHWLNDHYEFIPLDSVLGADTISTDRPKLLMCFDDGYASVFELAAPILRDLRIPWVFFINPAVVGNSLLAVDNIVSCIAGVRGVAPLSKLAGEPINSARQFISTYLSQIAPNERRAAVEELAANLNINTAALARESRLYVDEDQVRKLAKSGVEIGCHTFDHVHCRTLNSTTAAFQIEASAREVARMSGRPVRAFAYPYGSITDATPVARRAVLNAGHRCAFVVHNRANSGRTDRFALFRVDLGEKDDSRAVLELEVLPRMRAALAGIRAIAGFFN
jgi:peptidoglycan/xylan/chitin deacetylase (PgdA/CDA1 family)